MFYAIALIFCILIASGSIAFALYYYKIVHDKDKRIQQLEDDNRQLQSDKNALIDARARLEQDNVGLLDKINKRKEEIDQAKQDFELKFKDLAQTILESNSNKLKKENEEILKPFKDKLLEFQEKVEKTSAESGKAHVSLLEQIKHLTELNKTVSEETQNLTKALKGDSKSQGNWGELILEDLLERSGLEKGREYIVQGEGLGLKNAQGNASKPDVLIILPDNKNLIIDAKVSLTAYERLISAAEEDRSSLLRAHIASLKAHIDELAKKEYTSHDELRTPDFVMMFVPIEASLSLALQSEADLFVYGWDKRIILVTPTTLLMSLRTVANLWRHEKQSLNVLEIAKVGGQLYDKFVGFLEDMEDVKKSMEKAIKVHEQATSKIHGHGGIIGRIQKLQELGAKTTKRLKNSGDSETALLLEEDTL